MFIWFIIAVLIALSILLSLVYSKKNTNELNEKVLLSDDDIGFLERATPSKAKPTV